MQRKYLFSFVFSALIAVVLAIMLVWTFIEHLLGIFFLVFVAFIIDMLVCNDMYEHFEH